MCVRYILTCRKLLLIARHNLALACMSPSPVETELINDYHFHQNDNFYDFHSAAEYCEEIQFEIASVHTDESYSDIMEFTRGTKNNKYNSVSFSLISLIWSSSLYVRHSFTFLDSGTHTSSTWVDLHNPNTVVCSSPEECDLKYQTMAGAVVSTNHLTAVKFDGKAESCVTYYPEKTRFRAERCNQERRVICQYACGRLL